MVTPDRIRLTGLLRKSPACGAFLLLVVAPAPAVGDFGKTEQGLGLGVLSPATEVRVEGSERRVADERPQVFRLELRHLVEHELLQRRSGCDRPQVADSLH